MTGPLARSDLARSRHWARGVAALGLLALCACSAHDPAALESRVEFEALARWSQAQPGIETVRARRHRVLVASPVAALDSAVITEDAQHAPMRVDHAALGRELTEALATLLPEAVMEYTLDGTEPERVGNRHQDKAPHNVFRCQGEENWVAISVENDTQFRALAQAAGSPGWADDPRFATVGARLRHQDELEPLIQRWTGELTVQGVVGELQGVGVPAGPVLDSAQVLADPHMAERGFVRSPGHPEVGARPMGAFAWGVDGGPLGEPRAAPLFGEHNRQVMQDLLQVPDHEFKRLMESGVIG